MSSPHRKRRGAETAHLQALYLRQNGFPHASDTGAGRNGPDILETAGIDWEVKARRGLDLTGWLDQCAKRANDALPLLTVRPDGYGPTRIAQWPLITTNHHGIQLIRQAGYGEPLPNTHTCPQCGHTSL